MLLARKGYKVLVVDRATFPSDTISTHLIHPPGVAALERWGLLDRLVATGCPPIDTYAFDFGPFTIAGSPGTDDAPVAYGPRRTVLDKLLVDAASEAGAEVREGSPSRRSSSRTAASPASAATARAARPSPSTPASSSERTAGTRSSREAVQPEQYNEKPPLLCGYYTYWSGLPMDGRFEAYVRPDRGVRGVAHERRPDARRRRLAVRGVRGQQERHRRQLPQDVRPGAGVRRADPRRPSAKSASSARRCRTTSASPSGPAGRWSATPATTRTSSPPRASSDAFRDAELCADALDEAFSGARSFDDAMGEYQSTRDEHVLPMYEFTCQLATLEPPPPELQQLLAAVHGNQEAMDGFARVNAGVTSPAEFFSEENVGRIFAAADATISQLGQDPDSETERIGTMRYKLLAAGLKKTSKSRRSPIASSSPEGVSWPGRLAGLEQLFDEGGHNGLN